MVRSRVHRLVLMIGGLMCALGAAGCGGQSVGDRLIIDRAENLHRAIAPAVLDDDGGANVQAAGLRNYLQAIGGRLVAAAGDLHRERLGPPSHFKDNPDWMVSPAMRFHMVASPMLNAVTVGGQRIYVYSGLLARCQNEDELAAVMAHEYAHVYCRHIQRTLREESADVSPVLLVRRLIENRYKAADELEADEVAFAMYARAGWDVGRFADVLSRLPGNESRVNAIRTLVQNLPPASQDWARPAIADERHFALRKKEAAQLARGRENLDEPRRLLGAMPSCLAGEDQPDQKLAQKELLSIPVVDTPNPFEKGPRRPR